MDYKLAVFIVFMNAVVNAQQAVRGSSVMDKVRGKITKSFQCKDVSDLKSYANCPALKDNGNCELEKQKMKYYCPITCKLCEGASDFKVPSPPEPKCKTSLYGCCADRKTEAKGRDFLGCPEKCFDLKNYQCAFYESIGFCKFYKDDMLHSCPLTCDYCKPVQIKKPELEEPKDGCKDVWRTKFCEKLQKHKLCDSDKWVSKMVKVCKKTCRKCAKDAPLVPLIATECAKDDDCCWDKSRPVNGKCPECKDSFSKDFCFRFKQDCSKNLAVKSVQIRYFCPKTCGMCNANTCRDDIVYANFCEQWKTRGECKKYPEIMNIYCRKTCEFC